MKASILFFLAFVTLATAATPTTGQWEVRKRRSDGMYDSIGVSLADGQVLGQTGGVPAAITPASGAAWGGITGTLSSQSDLVSALAAKVSISALGTGVYTFLGTPTSANLAAAMTDETGTSKSVFSDAPTLSGTVTINNGGVSINDGSGHTVFAASASAVSIGWNAGFGTGSGSISWNGMYGAGAWVQTGGNAWITSFPLYVGGALGATNSLQITNAGTSYSTTLCISDGTNNKLEQRNGAAAQILGVSNTYSSTSSWEAFAVDWQASVNVCTIGTQAGSGGGTVRDLAIARGPSTHITLGNGVTTHAQVVRMTAGSAANPAFDFGTTGTGLFAVYGGAVSVAAGSSEVARFALTDCYYYTNLHLNGGFGVGSTGTVHTKIKSGVATLVAGTVTVSDSDVLETGTAATSSRIILTRMNDGGTVGDGYSITRSNGSSFTITSKTAGATQSADTSTLTWLLINP